MKHPDYHIRTKTDKERVMKLAVLVLLVFVIIELFGAYISNSLALFGDAMHLLTDAFALCIALFGSKNVFELVLMSWSILSAAFGPLLFLYAIGKKVSEKTSISMVLGAVIVTTLWKYTGLSSTIYEVAPGILSGLLIYAVFSQTKLNDLEKVHA